MSGCVSGCRCLGMCVWWCGVLVCVLVCLVWHAEKPRVYVQNVPVCIGTHAHMLKHMCAWCRYTRGRFECTHGKRFERKHGDVVDAYTPPSHTPPNTHSNTAQNNPTHLPLFTVSPVGPHPIATSQVTSSKTWL